MPHCHSEQPHRPSFVHPTLNIFLLCLYRVCLSGDVLCEDYAERPVNPPVAEISMVHTAVLSLTECSDTLKQRNTIYTFILCHILLTLRFKASTPRRTPGQLSNNPTDHRARLVFNLLGKQVSPIETPAASKELNCAEL